MIKEIQIGEETLSKADKVLAEEGVDIDTAINMFLKKIVRENSVGFLFYREDKIPQQNINKTSYDYDLKKTEFLTGTKMTKSLAKRLFLSKGINVTDDCYFASENSATHVFWANINNDILTQNWGIILNDKSKRVIYLFKIPSHEFGKDDFVMRADKPQMIDLQIAYNDPTFTDNRSHISFKPYFVDKITY